ncbi:contact-dependent growth inhibition system immunity protein [Luteimicrobium sp. NPDC057192]|uniref:contact-dependent growth inhibition system immunity protein n=1 Tax=Luteimicrobium sp. NPDC057192 TaxID=3346042 RepID=UPI00363AD197
MRRLRYLAQNYFHQDWDLDAPTPVGVLEVFRKEETPGSVAELRTEIQAILGTDPSESVLRDTWNRAGADWDPEVTKWGTYREWFDAMLTTVS